MARQVRPGTVNRGAAWRWWRAILFSVAALLCGSSSSAQTVARQWNEALLDAIRIDFPAPTVHSRNLYHSSAAMFDAWATFDPIAVGHFVTEKQSIDGLDVEAARNEAISFAAYRVLSERYTHSTAPEVSQNRFDQLMGDLGYDKNNTTTTGNSPAAIGNRIAAQILGATLNDGSNEANGYVDNTGYMPVNDPMVVDYPGVVTPDAPSLADPNRWQPLFLDSAVTQNGLEGESLQRYVGPHWGHVTTFALGRGQTSGPYSWSDMDPGPPPQLNGVGDAAYRSDSVSLIEYSSSLDPQQGPGATVINLSPNTSGNRPLGTHDNQGYAVNPVTGLPYADNFVKTADYGRVLAEFWADGPNSETPPGHWNVLANTVSDDARLERRIGGSGDVVGDLEWDVKLYLALNGAVHDAAVGAWGVKREYDYVRPITKIRYQGSLGQSTDATLPSYHPDGLPLVDDLIEVITADSIAPGGRHFNALENANRDASPSDPFFTAEDLIGKIAVRSWNHEPADPANETSGVAWILAENWVPYQDDNFVTPAFAAYISGHSTFSRAAAEVLAAFTGSPYFPGGLGTADFDVDYLEFEDGPTEPIQLQWATYFDAADEAGISRLWGGIHVSADDFAGRIMGSTIGQDAFDYAESFYIDGELDWHNRVFDTDVNVDGITSPLDALLVINELTFREFSDPVTGELRDFIGIPPFFYDVHDDGFLGPLDALLVINRLDGNTPASPLGLRVVPEPSAATNLLLAGLLCLIQSRSRR